MGKDLQVVNLKGISQDDGIIVVMGLTGAGKSTFIEAATRQDGRTVGHGLRSYTSDIRSVRFPHPATGRPVLFVDTPGFDDTFKLDIEVLTMIADWLVKTYKNKIRIAGIIYLHRISDNRMAAPSLANFHMFASMCGERAMPNVVLATTCWSEVREQLGVQREKELCDRFWKPMLDQGAKAMRFEDTFESAWAITDSVLQKQICPDLEMQEELVNGNQTIMETKAGKQLKKPSSNLLDVLTRKIQTLFSRSLGKSSNHR